MLAVHVQIISQTHLNRQAELGSVSGVYNYTYDVHVCTNMHICKTIIVNRKKKFERGGTWKQKES